MIGLALFAFAVEPRLWQAMNCGDENMLFRREDFLNPDSSNALRMLGTSSNPDLQYLSSHMRTLLRLPLAQVPSLDGFSIQRQPRETEAAVPESGLAQQPALMISGWSVENGSCDNQVWMRVGLGWRTAWR